MRRLADEMAIGKTTLYGYVETKEELLEGVQTLLLGRLAADLDDEMPWDEQLIAALRRLHHEQRAHPGFLDVLTTPNVPGQMLDMARERALRILRRAGFPRQKAAHALAAAVAFVLGFAVSDRARVRGPAEVRRMRGLAHDEYPYLSDTAAEWVGADPERDFEYGLTLLVDSLKARLAGSGSPP
jgi:AcrR family transcriptional regulator